jgi:hypothetical protein
VDLKLPNMDLVGVNLSQGPGVDQVIEIGVPSPFEDSVFDLVVTSSVFKHDI